VAYRLAIANQKGGVGKTTTAASLARTLAGRDFRTLAVDMDPQASLTLYFNVDPRALENGRGSVFDVLTSDRAAGEVITAGTPGLLPSSIRLASAEGDLMVGWDGATRLKSALLPLNDDYDCMLIDCSPSLGILTVNALAAAHAVLIPVKTDYLSLMGVSLLFETVTKIRARLNPDLEVLGVLPTMYDQRNSHDRDVLEQLTRLLDGRCRLFDTVRRTTAFDQASVGGLDMLHGLEAKRIGGGFDEVVSALSEEIARHG